MIGGETQRANQPAMIFQLMIPALMLDREIVSEMARLARRAKARREAGARQRRQDRVEPRPWAEIDQQIELILAHRAHGGQRMMRRESNDTIGPDRKSVV